VDKCQQNKQYPLESDLADGERYPPFEQPSQNRFFWETQARSSS